MLYCDGCRERNSWPKNLMLKTASCEICGKESHDCSETNESILKKMTPEDAPDRWRVDDQADNDVYPVERVEQWRRGPSESYEYEGEVRLEIQEMAAPMIKLTDTDLAGTAVTLDEMLVNEFGVGGEVLVRDRRYDGDITYRWEGERSLGRFKITIERIEDE